MHTWLSDSTQTNLHMYCKFWHGNSNNRSRKRKKRIMHVYTQGSDWLSIYILHRLNIFSVQADSILIPYNQKRKEKGSIFIIRRKKAKKKTKFSVQGITLYKKSVEIRGCLPLPTGTSSRRLLLSCLVLMLLSLYTSWCLVHEHIWEFFMVVTPRKKG